MSNLTQIANNITSSNLASSSEIGEGFYKAIGWMSLINIVSGVLGNIVCFVVFVSTRELRNMSFIVYLTYCSIANIISLFEWNFNDYLSPMHGIKLETASLAGCRVATFLQYFSLQSSTYFLSFMCIDRYVSVIAMPGSFASRLPFSTSKTAHFWSILTVFVVFALNSHILAFNGYYKPPELRNTTLINGSNQTFITYLYQDPDFNCGNYPNGFSLWPLWDVVHVYVYTIFPFILMTVFNLLLIVKTLLPNKNKKNLSKNNNMPSNFKANQDKAKMTRSILAITVSFLVLTLPADIAFGYFYESYDSAPWLFNLLDLIAFFHQSVLFLNCFTTNNKFRHRVVHFMDCICFVFGKRRSNQVGQGNTNSSMGKSNFNISVIQNQAS